MQSRQLKLSRNKKDLNDITATPFLVCLLLLAAEERSFCFRDDFSITYLPHHVNVFSECPFTKLDGFFMTKGLSFFNP